MGFRLIYDTAGTGGQDKMILKEFGDAYGLERTQGLRSAKDVLSYIERDSRGAIADTARNNLARPEHQRWNTFHLVKGWSPMPKEMVAALPGYFLKGVFYEKNAVLRYCLTNGYYGMCKQ
jgi:hypothetical protein